MIHNVRRLYLVALETAEFGNISEMMIGRLCSLPPSIAIPRSSAGFFRTITCFPRLSCMSSTGSTLGVTEPLPTSPSSVANLVLTSCSQLSATELQTSYATAYLLSPTHLSNGLTPLETHLRLDLCPHLLLDVAGRVVGEQQLNLKKSEANHCQRIQQLSALTCCMRPASSLSR